MSRAHRIGQSQTVNIYRFLTSGSVEEDILERAKQKMVLDHLVIQRMDTSGKDAVGASAGDAASLAPSTAAAALAAADAAASKQFSRDEMAAILRFGAEEIFKEDDATRGAAARALVGEDIDAILARAEIVDTSRLGPAAAPCADLLDSFNVTSFEARTAEDDAKFWDRIVPKDDRSRAADDEPAELGVRAARLKTVEDAAAAARRAAGLEDDGAFRARGRDPRTVEREKERRRERDRERRRERALAGATGVPVAGACLRVNGVPPAPAGADAAAWPTAVPRRDAGLFVRAARRYMRPDRIDEVAAEVGGKVATFPRAAQLALFHSLTDACREAAAVDPKGTDATVDWFGTPVKAYVGDHIDCVAVLCRVLAATPHPHATTFRVTFEDLPPPKWGVPAGWTTDDDAHLLLGVWRHGMGHWAAMAGDGELDLADKLAQAAQEKHAKEAANAPGLEHLPRGTHLETRAQGLLRRLRDREAGRPVRACVRSASRSATPGVAGVAAAAPAPPAAADAGPMGKPCSPPALAPIAPPPVAPPPPPATNGSAAPKREREEGAAVNGDANGGDKRAKVEENGAV